MAIADSVLTGSDLCLTSSALEALILSQYRCYARKDQEHLDVHRTNITAANANCEI